ncbi:MAG: N-acetylmuramic acid 6-phosphate etherase [Candidatus Brocadiae bacterium]|nr:N-acetylmuramic acid 6-phosphate etherase [Candidatus Brocadiia bacterium]
MDTLGKLITEKPNLRTANLDHKSIPEILQLIHEEDKKISIAIEEQLPNISKVVENIVDSFRQGGRLFFCGAGTSGRLAIMEASECPPTFSTPPEMVQGLMAGFPDALWRAVEGAEDSKEEGRKIAIEKKISSKDFVLGISASGQTPYVLGILSYAREKGAKTAILCANPPGVPCADCVIAPATGSEVLTGSTRMKAGTAAKMVLNMITTTSMICMGKVHGNLMVDLNPNSQKLVGRAIRIITEITKCNPEEAARLIQEAGNAKVAIVMYYKKVTKMQAKEILNQHNGKLRSVLENLEFTAEKKL